ncbi:hypothetical protein M422DRAFT_250127 [Sphaerobolus stellatus SS14]|nr:hypothetical protein M422DRAFT_250127 [Sphaerobolus stellatus SS14]
MPPPNKRRTIVLLFPAQGSIPSPESFESTRSIVRILIQPVGKTCLEAAGPSFFARRLCTWQCIFEETPMLENITANTWNYSFTCCANRSGCGHCSSFTVDSCVRDDEGD